MVLYLTVEFLLGTLFLLAVFLWKVDTKYADIYFRAFPEGYWNNRFSVQKWHHRLIRAIGNSNTRISRELFAQYGFILVAIINIANGVFSIIIGEWLLPPGLALLISFGYAVLFFGEMIIYWIIIRRR